MDTFISEFCSNVNGAPAYLRHHKKQLVAKPVVAGPIVQLSFETTRSSLLRHPFVSCAGISVDKIFRVLLAMLSPATGPSTPVAVVDAPSHFNAMYHKVLCERCDIVGMFERKHGSGGYTCQICGHANYHDVHFGEPLWLGADSDRNHWEMVTSGADARDVEHMCAVDRIGSLIHSSCDVRAHAMHMFRTYRQNNHITSIDVVAAAALIVATNPSILETQTVELPLRPVTPFSCPVCKSAWSRKIDARVCCRNGSGFTLRNVNRPNRIASDRARPAFEVDRGND